MIFTDDDLKWWNQRKACEIVAVPTGIFDALLTRLEVAERAWHWLEIQELLSIKEIREDYEVWRGIAGK
jgi:hypothetical protein